MSRHLLEHPVDILLVDDKVNVVHQIRHSLQQGKVNHRLHNVGDGLEARAYLRREGPYKHVSSPDAVLLNVSLPRKSGFDLLTELTTNPAFTGIPVIILARSESELRLIENFAFAVDGSIEESTCLPQLMQTLMSIDALSFVLVQSIPDK